MKTYRPFSGLFAFASTTLVLSLYNVQARGITVPNVVVGMAIFYGGLAQLLAGMWEFATGNTFGATGEYFGKFSHHHFVVVQPGTLLAHLFIAAILLITGFFLRVAFTSYGAFWLSFAVLFIPGSGVGDAYKAAAPGMEDDAIGIFLMAWMVVTALFL